MRCLVIARGSADNYLRGKSGAASDSKKRLAFGIKKVESWKMGSIQEITLEPLPITRASTELRRRKVLKGLIAGKSLTQSALDAGYSESSADQASRDIMPHIREAFQEAMHRRIPIGKLADTVAAGLDANETKVVQFEGKVTDQKDVIAWGERRRYSELAANLMGLAPDKTSNLEALGGSLQINFVSIAGDVSIGEDKP